MSDNSYGTGSHNGDPIRVSNSIDRILRSREPQERVGKSGKFSVYTIGDGRPQVAFRLRRKNGALDGFMYHNIENTALTTSRGMDYLSFDHRGKVVMIAGERLEPIFLAIMGLQLIEIIEPKNDSYNEEDVVIHKVEVTRI
ncbi:MAG: hypothetical protein ACSHXY_00540 [Alphaproteobacteria bacterium]